MRHSSYGKFLDSRKHGQFAIEFYDFFIYVVGEIVQELRALSGLPEDRGLIPRIHMVVLNHLSYNCRESTTL